MVASKGDSYLYIVDNFWVVESVTADHQVCLRTAREKRIWSLWTTQIFVAKVCFNELFGVLASAKWKSVSTGAVKRPDSRSASNIEI